VPTPAEIVNNKKLDALAQPKQEPAPAPAPVSAETKAELDKANEKLSSLLGKPK
jgi:hypothetical protein